MLLLTLLATALMPLSQPAHSLDALPYYPAPIDTVVVGDHPVAYYDSGGEGEAVLFVHGLGSNLSFWRQNLPAFEEAGYRVLAVDLPGYGRSGKDDVPSTMPFFAETLAGLLDTLEIGRVHLVGLSMGGQVGLTFALQYPERLERLVLVSPAGIETFTEQESAMLKQTVTPEAIQNEQAETVERNIALNFHSYDADRFGWILDQRLTLMDEPDFAGYAVANARAVAGMLDGPVADRLGQVAAPTLVLYGAGDKLIPNRYLHPGLTTEAVAKRAADGIPVAEMQLVDDAGHLLMIEQPEAFNAAALDFLAK